MYVCTVDGHVNFYKSAPEHRVVKSGEEWRWMTKVQIEVRTGLGQPPRVKTDTVEVWSTLSDNIQITALCDKYALLCQKKIKRKIFVCMYV